MTHQYCAVTATRTAADLVGLVRSNCAGHRAVRPVTAVGAAEAEVLGWVRGSQIHLPRVDEIVALCVADARRDRAPGAARPAGVDTRALLDLFTRDYVVLRAAWLWYAGASGHLPGLVPLGSSAAWRALHPSPSDDDFALDGGALKQHFRGLALSS
jgi:hypothetical protein